MKESENGREMVDVNKRLMLTLKAGPTREGQEKNDT